MEALALAWELAVLVDGGLAHCASSGTLLVDRFLADGAFRFEPQDAARELFCGHAQVLDDVAFPSRVIVVQDVLGIQKVVAFEVVVIRCIA